MGLGHKSGDRAVHCFLNSLGLHFLLWIEELFTPANKYINTSSPDAAKTGFSQIVLTCLIAGWSILKNLNERGVLWGRWVTITARTRNGSQGLPSEIKCSLYAWCHIGSYAEDGVLKPSDHSVNH